MNQYHIVFYETLEDEEEIIKNYFCSKYRLLFLKETIQDTNLSSLQAPLISIRTRSIIPLSWDEGLKGVLSRTTGFDHLKGIQGTFGKEFPVGYLPDYCSRSVAEHTIMLMFNLLRKFNNQNLFSSHYNSNDLIGSDCIGKNILIVGVGKIGYEIAKIAEALQMNVFGFDKIHKYNDMNYVDIESGLENANIIICSMVLNHNNFGFFNYEMLSKTAKGSLFINVSRGELSPISDIALLLKEGHLGGVALDVFENEDLLFSKSKKLIQPFSEYSQMFSFLAKNYNFLITPHNAFNTVESIDKKAKHSIIQVEHFMKYDHFKWNIPEHICEYKDEFV